MRSTTKNDFRRYVQLHKILFVKKKNTAHAAQAKDFVGVKRRQNESGVLRGGKNLHREQILATLYFSTRPRLRSNESPSGAFKRQSGLAQQDGGALPRQARRDLR